MTDPDFYSRDRPDDSDLPEDRPRGGGPENPRKGHRAILILAAVLIIVIVIGTILIF